METSTSSSGLHAWSQYPWMTAAALVCAALAAVILLWFLIRRPKLVASTKIFLFLGLGALPIGAAFSGNIVGFEHTSTRPFCGSCHVMKPYTHDAADPDSRSLAAMHSRNKQFGERSCYVCHSNYGMYGTVVTKAGGMRHVWMYYTGFNKMTIEEALPKIHLYEPFPNTTCTRCHSKSLPRWLSVPDHLAAELEDPAASCASAGCHGPAHPFSKPAGKKGAS